MNRMETTDVVLHKGERDKRYQLYVEDYVISYLKKYGIVESGTIFFYGTKQIKEKKYYIYGAGREKQITYFEKYELLEEVLCRMDTDMPVFSIQEKTEIYELAGYHIFYQANEAMQNYMVEQRKETQQNKDKEKTQFDVKLQQRINSAAQVKKQEKPLAGSQDLQKGKNGFMTAQLAAIFVVLIAIIINSTNSYTKLQDLNQAAVEVFFAIENQDASKEYRVDGNDGMEANEEERSDNSDISTEGNVLRLEDLDVKFEEENQAVKQEETETEKENQEEEADAENNKNVNETARRTEEEGSEESETDAAPEGDGNVSDTEETSLSQQAFARNFAEYYRIEKGDTLYTISIKIYGDTSKVNEICELNQISDPDNIKYGQKILLP